jgi:hypothetical protein
MGRLTLPKIEAGHFPPAAPFPPLNAMSAKTAARSKPRCFSTADLQGAPIAPEQEPELPKWAMATAKFGSFESNRPGHHLGGRELPHCKQFMQEGHVWLFQNQTMR